MFYSNMFEASSSYNNGRPENSSSNGQGLQDKYLSKTKTAAAGVPLPPPTPSLAMFDPYCLSSYSGAFPGFNPAFMGHHPPPPPHPPPPSASTGGGLFGGNPVFSPFVAPNYLDHHHHPPPPSPHPQHPTLNNSFNGFHHTQSLIAAANHHSYPHSIYSDTNGLTNFANNKSLTESPQQHHSKQHQNGAETTANGEISFSEQLKRLRQSLQSQPIKDKVKCECHRGKCSIHRESSCQPSVAPKPTEHNNHQSPHCSYIKKEFDDGSYYSKPKGVDKVEQQQQQHQKSAVPNNADQTIIESPVKEAKKEQVEESRPEAPKTDKTEANVSLPPVEAPEEVVEAAPKSIEPAAASEDKVASKKPTNHVRKRKLKSGLDMIRNGPRKKSKHKQQRAASPTPPPSSMNSKVKSMFDKKRFITNKSLGETLLHRSARNNKLDIVKYCLETADFCDVNVRDNAGYTPLHECSSRGHIEIAKLLLEHSADVNASATGGIRPLHDAIENDHIEVARLLFSYGADPYVATHSGSLPLQLSCSKAMTIFLTQFYKDISLDECCDKSNRLPWKFSNDMIDYNIFSDLPSEDEEDAKTEYIITSSEKPLLTIYHLNGQPNLNFYLLSDVLERLNLSETEFTDQYGAVKITKVEGKQFNKLALANQLEERVHKLAHQNSQYVPVIAEGELINKILGIQTTTVIQS